MPTPPNPPALDYKSPSHSRYIPPLTPEERRWLHRRLLFFATLAFLFYIIACQVGPNLILFGKATRLAPTDFVSVVQKECVPIVRAIKEFQRDNGSFPATFADLVPKYLPAEPEGNHLFTGAAPGKPVYYFMYTHYEHRITYEFTLGRERWLISGPFVHGEIPVPPVTVSPSSAPPTSP